MPPTSAAILAGGRAARMGGANKALLEVGGRAILERQLEVLAPLFPDIAICAGDAAPYERFGLPVLPDREPGAGPLAGVAAALAWSGSPWVFAVACDMPHLDRRVIELLLEERRERVDLVAPVIGGRPEPLHALYHRRCLPAIEARLAAGRRKAGALIADTSDTRLHVVALDEHRIRISIPDLDPSLPFLTNVNEPSDLP